jgi:uncharacterized protein (DUF885 family)
MGAVRDLADRFTEEMFTLDPNSATFVGAIGHDDRLTDNSPDGHEARAELVRRTLAELAAISGSGNGGGTGDVLDERCGRLLRERLEATLLIHDHGEHLRMLNNIASPAQELREVFDVTPSTTPEEWEVLATRLDGVPLAYEQFQASLQAGAARGEFAAPRQVATAAEQLAVWSGQRDTPAYFTTRIERAPEALTGRLTAGAAAATETLAAFRRYLLEEYAPGAEGTPDAVGWDRYRRWVRYWNGIDLDLEDGYAYGWEEFHRLDAELRSEAERNRPGATPLEAMQHLDAEGPSIEGQEVLREWLQGLMTEAIRSLDGRHFDLAPELHKVESRLAPPGGPAAAFYTPPSEDFSRPGCTWFPTQGRTRFATWDQISTWYHEGVPGHHLQLAQWILVKDDLSRFQTTLGWVSANCEGWALYAERLMDELGFFEDPGRRLGFLVGQQLRAVRVVIDIGMHLELEIPTDQPFHPGERWTPELGREFLLANAGSDTELLESEIIRYLGMPGQAIGYKLGERVWLAGRAEAKRRRGDAFDLRSWHMAALGQGSLGLGDLYEELAAI